MSQVLYRQYRPRKFSEVINQAAIKTILQNSITENRVAHAYLFTGPRGVGKTSVARILAKSLNCVLRKAAEPCDNCQNCAAIAAGNFLDLIEIDAASHTGVDNIREIIEHVKFSPSAGKYKIIVIDEVHMLSKGAFNALLKTLEEPPAHAVFILATTELNKVPVTIVSRTQRFDFKRLSNADIIKQLQDISKDIKLKVPVEVLKLIARAAGGGMRDALSLFDQLISFGSDSITLEEAEDILGLSPFTANQDFFEYLKTGDKAGALNFLKQLSLKGRDVVQFSSSFLEYLDLVFGQKVMPAIDSDLGLTAEDKVRLDNHVTGMTQQQFVKLINIFLSATSKIKSSPIPELPLEIAAVEFILQEEDDKEINSSNGGLVRSVKKQKLHETTEGNHENKTPSSKINTTIAHSVNADAALKREVTENLMGEVSHKWNEFLSKLREYNHSLITSLKLATLVSCDGKRLVIAFPYRFHKDAVDQVKNKIVIEKVLADFYGRPLKLETCMVHEVQEPRAAAASSLSANEKGLLEEALEVFGKVAGIEG